MWTPWLLSKRGTGGTRNEQTEERTNDIDGDEMTIRTAIITLSDKGSKGEREDESGKIIREMITGINAFVGHYEVLPDEKSLIIEVP